MFYYFPYKERYLKLHSLDQWLRAATGIIIPIMLQILYLDLFTYSGIQFYCNVKRVNLQNYCDISIKIKLIIVIIRLNMFKV